MSVSEDKEEEAQPCKLDFLRTPVLGSRKADLLPDLLADFPIVAIGDDDLTFALALAAARGSWSGVVALSSDSDAATSQLLEKASLQVQQQCRLAPTEPLPIYEDHILRGLTASNLNLWCALVNPSLGLNPRRPFTLWVQYSWLARQEATAQVDIFFRQCASQQESGFLCVDVPLAPSTAPFAAALQRLLTQGLDGYFFLGASLGYSRRLAAHGHCPAESLTTLCFRRCPGPVPAPSPVPCPSFSPCLEAVEQVEGEECENERGLDPAAIQQVVRKAHCTRAQAAEALRAYGSDLVSALMVLTM